MGRVTTNPPIDPPTRGANPLTAEQRAAFDYAMTGPAGGAVFDPRHWGIPSEQDMRELRDRAAYLAAYISPEMGAFSDEDGAYLERFFTTAQRIADWIKDGV